MYTIKTSATPVFAALRISMIKTIRFLIGSFNRASTGIWISTQAWCFKEYCPDWGGFNVLLPIYFVTEGGSYFRHRALNWWVLSHFFFKIKIGQILPSNLHQSDTLSDDPGKVDRNFFCYAATALSPHRNVLIFTQRMHKPTWRPFTQ